jgi:Ca2+-binding EF-hand superfamily protein
MSDEVLKQAFQVFDTDNSGTISLQELKAMLEEHAELGAQLVGTDVAKIFQDVDVDGSGEVDFEEFKAMMMSG